MARVHESGFTLIELIMVIAITGSLLAIAMVGQGQLRGQAQFDSAVNKIVSSISDAHNESTSGINVLGQGDGTSTCPTAAISNNYIFAGVAWVAVPAGGLRMDFYKADPDAGSVCVFTTQKINTSSPVTVTTAAGQNGPMELFVRKNNGSLDVCPADLTTDVKAAFLDGSCAAGSLTLIIRDDQNRRGEVEVDPSGLARRIN